MKADTIPTWNVYYNNKLLKQFTSNSISKEIQIEISAYKPGDYIAIEYNDDIPCLECEYEILLKTEHNMEVTFSRFKDKYKLMKFDVKHIIYDSKEDQLDTVVVYLKEIDKNGSGNSGVKLFTIKIN